MNSKPTVLLCYSSLLQCVVQLTNTPDFYLILSYLLLSLLVLSFEFHSSVLYQINLTVSTSTNTNTRQGPVLGNSSLLRIEVEQVDNENNDRWSGEFTSQCKKIMNDHSNDNSNETIVILINQNIIVKQYKIKLMYNW